MARTPGGAGVKVDWTAWQMGGLGHKSSPGYRPPEAEVEAEAEARAARTVFLLRERLEAAEAVAEEARAAMNQALLGFDMCYFHIKRETERRYDTEDAALRALLVQGHLRPRAVALPFEN